MSTLLTTNQAAAFCTVSRKTFIRWAAEVGLRADRRVGPGQRARYTPQALEGLMRLMAERPKTKPARARQARAASRNTTAAAPIVGQVSPAASGAAGVMGTEAHSSVGECR